MAEPAQAAAAAAEPQADVESQAIIARARRVAACEREVFAAIEPILQRHRCRLGTIQEVIDGRGGATRIVVFPTD